MNSPNLERLNQNLRETASEHLSQSNINLPILPNQPDTELIRQLNNTLNDNERRDILNALSEGSLPDTLLRLLINGLNRQDLQDFLNLALSSDINNYRQFANLIVYFSTGMPDMAETIIRLHSMIDSLLSEEPLVLVEVPDSDNIDRHVEDSDERVNEINRNVQSRFRRHFLNQFSTLNFRTII